MQGEAFNRRQLCLAAEDILTGTGRDELTMTVRC